MDGSPWALVVLLLPAALLVAVLVLVLVFRRRIQEWIFPGIGMREWADTVKGLSLRERWAVERANTRGRPPRPTWPPPRPSAGGGRPPWSTCCSPAAHASGGSG